MRTPISAAFAFALAAALPASAATRGGFELSVREIRLSAGAGFLVPLCGDIRTMPGLPRVPNASRIDLDEEGRVVGLF